MAKMIMISKCEKCGKPQPKNEEKSNKNWAVFDTNATCECGGKFITEFVVEEKKKR